MFEDYLASSLIEQAQSFFSFDQKVFPYPTLIFNQSILKKYDIERLREILETQNYTMCKLEDAPAPYCFMSLKNKMYLTKKRTERTEAEN